MLRCPTPVRCCRSRCRDGRIRGLITAQYTRSRDSPRSDTVLTLDADLDVTFCPRDCCNVTAFQLLFVTFIALRTGWLDYRPTWLRCYTGCRCPDIAPRSRYHSYTPRVPPFPFPIWWLTRYGLIWLHRCCRLRITFGICPGCLPYRLDLVVVADVTPQPAFP